MGKWLLKIITFIMNPMLTLVLEVLISILTFFVTGLLVLNFNFVISLSNAIVANSVIADVLDGFQLIGISLLGLALLIFVFKCISKYLDGEEIDLYRIAKHIVVSIFALFLVQPLTFFAFYFSNFVANAIQNRYFSFGTLTYDFLSEAGSGLSQAVMAMAVLPTGGAAIIAILILIVLGYILFLSFKLTAQIGVRTISFIICAVGAYFSVCYFALGETGALKKYSSNILHLSVVHILQITFYMFGTLLLTGGVQELDFISQWFFALCTFYGASNIQQIVSSMGFDGADNSKNATATLMTSIRTTADIGRMGTGMLTKGG